MEFFMKVSALLAALAVSLAAAASAQAQTPAPAPVTTAPAPTTAKVPVDFATQKANILNHIDQRMASMTAARECVNSANTKVDLKACHKANHRHAKHRDQAPA
jgi:hypothetical protein